MMEVKKQNKFNSYDDIEIKCPYCFNTFFHNEVGFRTEPISDEKIDDYKRKLNSIDVDEDEADEYKKKLENAKKFVKQKDKTWHEYWEKIGFVGEAVLFENGDGYDEYGADSRPSALSDVQDPIIGLGNDDLIGKKKVDSDGFVTSAVDGMGKETNRRICPHCHNKLPKDYGKNPVKFIAVVGISGSGKTVMLSQLIENIEDYATNVGGKITFDNSDSAKKFSLEYKVKTNEALPSGTKEHFSPPIFLQFTKTENKHLKKTTIVIYDIAGESCINASGIEKYGPFIRNSNGIIFLLDPRQISAFSCADENVGKPTAVLNAMGKAFLLDNNDVCKVPLAVAYSKSDKFQNVGVKINEESNLFKEIEYTSQRGFMLDQYKNVRFEVEELLKKYSSTFYHNIIDLFENYGFFAFSALGHDAEMKTVDGSEEEVAIVTMNLEPKRLEEPLLWLLYKWKLIDGVSQPKPESKSKLSLWFGRK